jgi:hypothetical protein
MTIQVPQTEERRAQTRAGAHEQGSQREPAWAGVRNQEPATVRVGVCNRAPTRARAGVRNRVLTGVTAGVHNQGGWQVQGQVRTSQGLINPCDEDAIR